jgi:HSP20 family protein
MELINYKTSNNLMDIIFNFDGYVDNIRSKSLIEPNYKIKENQENYYLYLNIPGIDKQDIDLNVDNNALIIKTNRKKNKKNHSYYGATLDNYYKSFDIPDNVEIDKTKATSKNGILTIKIPKMINNKSDNKKIIIS